MTAPVINWKSAALARFCRVFGHAAIVAVESTGKDGVVRSVCRDEVTGKKKYPHALALEVARALCAALEPLCERIIIAGSLRRGKAEVSDAEILYIPRREIRAKPGEMFTTESVSLADEAINAMLAAGTLQKRPSRIGVFTWGDENKHSIHAATGVPIDFFGTDASRLWVALVIRTGSKETVLRLTTGAQRMGRTLHAYGSGVSVLETGEKIDAQSEEDVFSLCNVPFLLQKDR